MIIKLEVNNTIQVLHAAIHRHLDMYNNVQVGEVMFGSKFKTVKCFVCGILGISK